MKDLWKAINILHPLITKARFDHVAVVLTEYEDPEEEGEDPIPLYEVRVQDSLFSREQMENLNQLFRKDPKFRGLSYQLWLSDKALVIFEVDDPPGPSQEEDS